MGFTTSLSNNIMNHVFRGVPYSAPTTVYVGLFVGGSEVSSGGYVRQPISFGSPNNGVITNNEEIRFPLATSDWGEVTHGALFDSETGGNRLTDETFNVSREVRENDQVIFGVGSYTVRLEPKE